MAMQKPQEVRKVQLGMYEQLQ